MLSRRATVVQVLLSKVNFENLIFRVKNDRILIHVSKMNFGLENQSLINFSPRKQLTFQNQFFIMTSIS